MISCVLLSAGESQRFGSPKALATLGKHTAIEKLQSTLVDSPVDEIIVVLGAHLDAVKPYVFNHKKVRIVYNKDHKLGQTSSFQAGLSAVAKESKAVFLAPVDCPLVQILTISALIDHFKKNDPAILVPAYKGKRGHPPLFNISFKKEILALPTSTGLNTLFEKYIPDTLEINDPGIIRTFNTPTDLEQIKKNAV